MSLTVNSVIRITDGIHDGVYRIIAIPAGFDAVFLYRLLSLRGSDPVISPEESKQHLAASRSEKIFEMPARVASILVDSHQLEHVSLVSHPKYLRDESTLTVREREIYAARREAAKLFLDHQLVCNALLSRRGLGKLIAQIRETSHISRATCYRMWHLLCTHGLNLSSLNPRLDRCGAPGVIRPWSEERKKAGRKTLSERLGIHEPFPQVGVTIEARQKIFAAYKVFRKDPKLSFGAIFDKILATCFAQRYSAGDFGVVPIEPVRGSYPNKAQVRRIVNSETNKLARILSRTTAGYFNRNHRGLIGYAWDGVAGPGHVYAIDSTVADIYLRSRVNRAWSIGRPIVYVVVDVWSTAVVGFHVCLSGPSWETAKVALFSTTSSVAPASEMWGIDAVPQLTPSPCLPHAFLCDRGEYLSMGALATGEQLGINMQYNPSYRPDLKGVVEVLHRIAKDQQFQFIPGAIDARKKEIDLRAQPRDSIFTLDEYVQYLCEVFGQYNFFSDRSHRLNTEMISLGVEPTPAGLWRYGHEVGIGYRKEETAAKLVSALLPSRKAIVSKGGVYFGKLKYEADFVNEKMWPALARNFGAMEVPMSYFPGNNEKIWWQDLETGQMRSLKLSQSALAPSGLSLDEWLDAYTFQKLKKDEREHRRNVSAIEQLHRNNGRIARASEETKKADQAYEGLLPSMRVAKSIEVITQCSGADRIVAPINTQTDSQESPPSPYELLMDELFASDAKVEK